MMQAVDIQPLLPDGVQALIVFDDVCVMCNGFARFVAHHDSQKRFHLTSAQGPLGQKLYAALDLPLENFETNLVIIDGVLYQKMASFAAAMGALGLPWSMLKIVNLVPHIVADWLYDRIAQNRYRLFGKHDHCPVPPLAVRERLI